MRRRFDDEDLDWRFNKDFPDYEFSENGDVWDVVKKRYLKISRPLKGSPVVGLRDRDGENRVYNLAKILLETFRGKRGQGYRVGYLDGNKNNVEINNLYWKQVDPKNSEENNELIPGRPDIKLSDFYKNTYVKVRETGAIYYNIWAYIQATNEKEAIAKKCLRERYMTTSKGHHLIPYKYDNGYEIIDLEGSYE